MPSLDFLSPEQIKENTKKERLEQEGGIYYEKIKKPEPEGPRGILNIFGVEVETYATEEDIEQIKKEMLLTKLDKVLFRRIAECYKLKQPLLFEGDPGAGKTFDAEKFVELIHGRNTTIMSMMGTPKTTELDIFGHWAPRGLSKEEQEKYQDLLHQEADQGEISALQEEFRQKTEELSAKYNKEENGQEVFREEFGRLSAEYTARQKEIMKKAIGQSNLSVSDSEWEFKEGPLLKCYSGNNGKGYPLIVDEFNSIPSNYQQIFLQISGKDGSMSDAINFWGNTDKNSYKRGDDSWIFFASNFPEKTPGRAEVVAPMSDRLVWHIIPDDEYIDKKRAIKRTAGGRLKKRTKAIFESGHELTQMPVEKGVEWDKVLDEQLGEQIADTIDLLDEEFVEYYQSVGDSLPYGQEERRRTQKLEFSGRNALRLFSYIDHFQVRDQNTGRIDFAQTIRNAFETHYLNRLASPKVREKMRRLGEEILIGDTGKIEVNFDYSGPYVKKFEEEYKKHIETIKEDIELVENDELVKVEDETEIKDSETQKKAKERKEQFVGLLNQLYMSLGLESDPLDELDLDKLKQKAKEIHKQNVQNYKTSKDRIIDQTSLVGTKSRKEIFEYLTKKAAGELEEYDIPELEYESPRMMYSHDIKINRPIYILEDEMMRSTWELALAKYPAGIILVDLGRQYSEEPEPDNDKRYRELEKNYWYEFKKRCKMVSEITKIGTEVPIVLFTQADDKQVCENEAGKVFSDLLKDKNIIHYNPLTYDIKKLKDELVEKNVASLEDNQDLFLMTHSKVLRNSIDFFLKVIGPVKQELVKLGASIIDERCIINKHSDGSENISSYFKDYIEKNKDKPIILLTMNDRSILERYPDGKEILDKSKNVFVLNMINFAGNLMKVYEQYTKDHSKKESAGKKASE